MPLKSEMPDKTKEKACSLQGKTAESLTEKSLTIVNGLAKKIL